MKQIEQRLRLDVIVVALTMVVAAEVAGNRVVREKPHMAVLAVMIHRAFGRIYGQGLEVRTETVTVCIGI